jgi:predicted aspartyl protease
MMTGEVTPDKEAVVKLILRGPAGDEQEVAAVLDTGFTEYMTLPPAVISALNLSLSILHAACHGRRKPDPGSRL